jgi:meiotically up-regulated gene 157 (Mug157) protein
MVIIMNVLLVFCWGHSSLFSATLMMLAAVTFALVVATATASAGAGAGEVPHVRPARGDRTFSSPAINALIEQLTPLFKDENMATLFSNCLPNSLDTTILHHTTDPLDSFVITGDIEAMWLRDSTNQLIPYVPYASQDSKLAALLEGLIARQARSVIIDPFANAFNYNASGEGHQTDNRYPPMGPAVFEGKYEIDSISAFLKVSYWYWKYTDVTSFMTDEWFEGVTKVLDTIDVMIETDGETPTVPYYFQRLTQVATDTLMISGRGPPAKKCGLTRSLFRPSDDSVTLPYNIPGNAMACTELVHLQELLSKTKLGM